MTANKTLIIGLGKSGLATAKFLFERKIPFAVCDTREVPPNLEEFKNTYPMAPIHLGSLSKNFLDKAEEIIVSPGLSIKEPLIAEQIEKGKKIVGDVELFLRYCQAPICAITGSNAKSTVTSLVYEMAKTANIKVKIGGNIGTPVLGLLEDVDTELYVLELSSFQLETTHSLRAKVATILNISPDHMDRYESLDDYVAAKERIYQNCETAVINRADEATFVKNFKPTNTISFALDKPSQNNFGIIENHLALGEIKLLATSKTYLQGLHHWENALAALALGQACKLPMSAMLETLKSFKGLEHRCQLIKTHNKVAWYNDSKGTNEGAAKAAIESIGKTIKGKVILIAGGVGKSADFTILVDPVRNYVSHAILMGEAKQQLLDIFQDVTQTHKVSSLDEAVLLANNLSQVNDAVLLSPACASFDMFQNFEKRGEAFETAVMENVT